MMIVIRTQRPRRTTMADFLLSHTIDSYHERRGFNEERWNFLQNSIPEITACGNVYTVVAGDPSDVFGAKILPR
jgi:hypothetical protein